MKAGYAALAVLLGVIIINYSLYAYTVAFDLPEGDHWRWLRQGLIPLLDGEKNFWQYLTVEFVPLSHSHILTLIEVWLNYHLFDLDYRLESVIGLLGMLGSFTVLCRWYWLEPGSGVPDVVKGGMLVCIALVLLNQRNILSWTLVQFENLYLLVTLCYLAMADACFAGRVSRKRLLLATLFMFFLGEAVGVAAILAVMVFIAVLAPRREYKLLLSVIGLVVICTVLSLIVIRGVNPLALIGRGGGGQGIVSYIFANALDFIKTVLMLLAQALGGQQEFRFYGGDIWLLKRYIVGFGVACFMAVAALAYMHYRERLVNTRLPMLLILLCLASLTGIILTRFQAFGTDIAGANRYIRLFQVGLVGAIWINSALLVKLYREMRFRPVVWGAAAFCVTIITGSYLVESHFYWRFHEAVLDNREQMADAYRRYAEDDSVPVGDYHARCANHFCRDSIAFLKQNKLSLFRE